MKTLQIVLLILSVYSVDVQSKFFSASIARERLMTDLFVKYDDEHEPNGKAASVDVNVQVHFEHFDFQETDGTFHFVGNLIMTWIDKRLKWNPNDYNNLTEIPIHQKIVWVPDIEIYNNAPHKFFRSHRNGAVVLSYTGELVWADSIEMNIFCTPDMYNWPHDTHDCLIRLGSWTYNALEMNITSTTTDINKTMSFENVVPANMEYRITKYNSNVSITTYECCVVPYTNIDYSLTIARRSAYVVIFRMAALCVILLSLLSLVIQPHCIEKLWLNGVSLIVITFQLLHFATHIGNFSRGTPAMVIFFSCCFVLVTLTQLISVFSLMATRAHYRGSLPAACSRFLNCSLANCIANKANTVQNTVESHTRFEDVKLQESSSLIASSSTTNEWTKLATVVERSALFVFGIVYIVLSSKCFV